MKNKNDHIKKGHLVLEALEKECCRENLSKKLTHLTETDYPFCKAKNWFYYT